ncbi:hypothetical protein CS537_18280 [Yersinia mollaretii]|nr:hypothetical protein CS537_18280 [Yersinia mollaretii]
MSAETGEVALNGSGEQGCMLFSITTLRMYHRESINDGGEEGEGRECERPPDVSTYQKARVVSTFLGGK